MQAFTSLGAAVGLAALVAVAGGCGSSESGASKADYCAAAMEVIATLGVGNSNPADAERGITKLVTAIQNAADIAPSEIKSEAATVAEGAQAIQAAWAANDYDRDKTGADPAYAKATQDAEYQTAHETVDGYNTNECGMSERWP